jgi:hypothetical protein
MTCNEANGRIEGQTDEQLGRADDFDPKAAEARLVDQDWPDTSSPIPQAMRGPTAWGYPQTFGLT